MLADFGAAFMRQRASRITAHGGAIGSSGYMSPEQARGQEVDARSDLYSTAVMAYELLTGQRPWDGHDGLAIALAQLEQPVPRLPDHLRHWQAFFDKALAVNPAQRYASAAMMEAAIHNLQAPPSGPSKARMLMDSDQDAGLSIAGGAGLYKLARGTPVADVIRNRWREYQWMYEQQIWSRERFPILASEQYTQDLQRYGEWEANLREADRVAVPRTPPPDWDPIIRFTYTEGW